MAMRPRKISAEHIFDVFDGVSGKWYLLFILRLTCLAGEKDREV